MPLYAFISVSAMRLFHIIAPIDELKYKQHYGAAQ